MASCSLGIAFAIGWMASFASVSFAALAASIRLTGTGSMAWEGSMDEGSACCEVAGVDSPGAEEGTWLSSAEL